MGQCENPGETKGDKFEQNIVDLSTKRENPLGQPNAFSAQYCEKESLLASPRHMRVFIFYTLHTPVARRSRFVKQTRGSCRNEPRYYFIIRGQHRVGVRRGRKRNARVFVHRRDEDPTGARNRIFGWRFQFRAAARPAIGRSLKNSCLFEHFDRMLADR